MESGNLPNLKTLLLTMMMFKWGTLCTATADICLSAPCKNGAMCVQTMHEYACICPTQGVRYMGKHCDELYDACSFAPCEECVSTPGTTAYRCVCPEGLTGDNCTEEVNECQSSPCSQPRSLCVDELNGYFCRCPVGYAGRHCQTHVTDCIDEPCQNNSTCVLRPNGFECRCAPGFGGKMCEEDVNECLSEPCQNGAICVDGVAEYHCFCVPGFQGYNCEIDINECASWPCKNNATCINDMDHYLCECLPGFTGVNCEMEVDECESSPCQNNATCHDLTAMYMCDCLPGYDGSNCEVDVDECVSEPCQNGAICQDMVNSYECDCAYTGYEGTHCEEDIPECASSPCQHGGTCLEGIKGYSCVCWTGYEGQNCEIDIDECSEQPCENGGQCLERSSPLRWDLDWELRFDDAAGYICQCQPGFAGENCSVNIDDCESEPCQNGAQCEDHINSYTCTCSAGFLGDHCEVNINECESEPCQNGGQCVDGVSSYTCHCPEADPGELPWGGDHCDVRLDGCVDHKCYNGATCQPWLVGEEHGHTCMCPHGFYDDLCSTQTTFSFSTPGFVHIDCDRNHQTQTVNMQYVNHISEIHLRFRTTIPDVVLFYRGDLECYVLLEIRGCGLHASVFCGETDMAVTFTGCVNDGDWWGALVLVHESSLELLVKGPGCDKDGCRVTDENPEEPFQPSETFPHVYVGGAPEKLLELTGSGSGFIGCMEDLVIDSKPILPQTFQQDSGPELGCNRTEWCKPDPCFGHGRCEDLWTSFHCDCYRPFYGESCAEEFPSWTYSHEDGLSFSSYEVGEDHGSSFNVSFILRSLRPDGLLFQLRRPSEENGGELYFSVYLGMGRVHVSSLPTGRPLTAPVFVTSGDKVLLKVRILHEQVFIEHSGLHYGIGEIPPVYVTRGDVAYVGGLPGHYDSDVWGGHFKGCLQDVRLDTYHLNMGAHHDSHVQDVYLPSEAENIMMGCVSDDTCKTQPCQNGGECSVTFNDFTCSCPSEYVGKTCETRVWCISDPCVNGGHCVDLPDGYECVHNATFENRPVWYSAGGSLAEPVSTVSMELRTRSEYAVLLQATRGSDVLMLGLLDSIVYVEISTGNDVESLTLTGVSQVADGRWHHVTVSLVQKESGISHWIITVDGICEASSATELHGGLDFLNEKDAVLTVAQSFTGCLGAIRVGGVYLPFMDDYRAPQASQFHMVGKTKIDLGCHSAPVCDSDPCLNGATCQDLFYKFGCACGTGWEGELCERDTDDCVSQPCVYGHCKDYLGGFECQCSPGFAGKFCEEDVDECEHHRCEHGGKCQDGTNTYLCICPKEYSGPLCQWDYPPLKCGEDVHCANDGVCTDGLWGANCSCIPGFTGTRCEVEINECESNPCRNGGSCLDRFNMYLCECPLGYSGPVCDVNKQAQKEQIPWLVIAIPSVCFFSMLLIIGATFMVLTARKKRQSEGAYSPSAQELAGARLEMDSMLKVPPEERLI